MDASVPETVPAGSGKANSLTEVSKVGGNGLVLAAGGVISRVNWRGQREVLLVYRSTQDDWTFPKGKVEPGETLEQCALREVLEETSLSCSLGYQLPSVSYVDRKGRAKLVRYWTMEVVGGKAAACNEVERVCWLSINSASLRLTYTRDRALLSAFAALKLSSPAKIPDLRARRYAQ
jgi:8-oxo-dGTP pyrophosphatase MutT (NUDIX family)